ncbi:hypothetical protein WJX82_003081 [Trebouxia sp. C0006]
MVAKQQEVVDRLRSLDRSTRLKAVREIKNQIIGNKSKKLSYIKLEAVPRVVELLQENADAFLVVQSAATVGSFAYGLEDGFRAVVASGGVQHLLHAVSSQDNTVVEAALRALKLVWQSSGSTPPHQLDGLNLERLISLLSASSTKTSEIATQVLAQYCQCANMEILARLAQDPNVASALMQLLVSQNGGQEAATWHNRPCFKEGILRALAILCKNHSDACTNFMERASIGQVARALDDSDVQVRAAACACIQSLSGSMKCLRHIPMAELMPPMLRLLLLQPEPELQHSALKALSNLVLDTASAKDNVAQSAVMAALPWNQFVPLLQDTNSCVQDKSFMFMRNLAAGRSAAECVKQWSGGSAVPALVARMQELPPPQHILVHILYCLSNFASTGSEEDRDAIASVAGECIKAHLHHEGVEVRTAALWVILNLTDGADDDAPDRAMKRIQQFQSLGTEERLRDMLQDMSLDVRERWVSFVLSLKVTKLEQLQSGALYCQILDAYEGKVQLQRVNFEAQREHDFIPNYKQLQLALTASGATQDFDWQQMMKSPVANWHFVRWLAQRYDGREPLPGYDPVAQRQEAATATARRTSSGALPGSSSGWLTPRRQFSGNSPWVSQSRGPPSTTSTRVSVPTRRPPPLKREYSGPGAWRPQDEEAHAMPSFVSAISTAEVSQTASEANTPPQHQASSESASTVSARQLPEQQQWDSSQATSGFMRASPFAAWSPAQPELPLPPGDTANQKPPWQSVSRSPSGPARKASSTIPAGRLMSTSASILNTADSLTTGRMLPTRRDREAMSSLDPEQVAVLGNAGGVLMQADEAGQSAVTVVLRSLQDLERLVKEASSKDVRDGAALRVKVHLRRERLGVAIQQAWILLQDLHQLSAVQGGRLGRARARRMESLMKELDSSEKQWVEVCGQIDKLDKFFPLGSLAMTKAREAQAAAIARGISDTRQLDSVLRSVGQAQAGLSTVFEALAPLERRSLHSSPLQLRQVPQTVSSLPPPFSPTHPKAIPVKAKPVEPPVAPKPTPGPSPSKKKRMAWICCKASPTKPDYEKPAARVPAEREQAVPSLEQLPNGDSFKGQYTNGAREGHAVYHFANGDVYEGQFGQDRMQGSGIYTFSNEGKYAGQWAGGVYHGLGCESFVQGSTYNGNFQEGRRHGFGVCEYHNGDYYEGEWQMGVRQGLGMQQCTDNSNYAGQYSRGLRHGFGAYSFPNGDRYLGQCDSDVPHGYGTYLFASGQAYEGQWAHGRKHGWCVYTVEDGQQWAGKWQEGRPRWVERLQQERAAHELADSHAEAVDLCLEAARMARDAGVEGALRADQHWLPQGTMQVNIQATTKASQQAKAEAEAAQAAAQEY